MNIWFIILIGFLVGFGIKQIVNWLNIEGFRLDNKNIILELINGLAWWWAYSNLNYNESFIFVMIFGVLSGISIIDMNTFQIPLIFIILGCIFIILDFSINEISFPNVFWGIFIGSILPLFIIGFLWLITKRQGMGFGDIQLGFVLGAWLGPLRMAITLFTASLLSLLFWVITSFFKGFNKDRAIPMAPFLSISAVGVFIGSFYFPNLFQLLVLK
tara:strand:+ start:516 stop:1160 length:645 start_codon:yes stop_codon:yes gene_type:complete